MLLLNTPEHRAGAGEIALDWICQHLLSDSTPAWETVQVPQRTGGLYGGVGAEERRAVRRARLLESALELLGTEGWQATTVRAICSQAKLTPRYLYESFRDRDELLLALFDEIAQEGAAKVLAGVAAAPEEARAKSRAAIGAFVELLTDDPRKARVLFVEATGSEHLAARRFEALRMFARLVAGQARQFYETPDAEDSLVDVTALMLVGGLAEVLLSWLDGTLRVTREQLIDDCTDLFVATGESAVALVRARQAGR
jgi:AcrR family transcriptional regulator